MLTIGANDFTDHHDEVTAGRCDRASGGDCLGDEVEQLRRNVRAVLARVRELRTGRHTAVLVTGYWNVFEDGQVAREAFPDSGVAASIRLTLRTNRALQQAAAGATYVDLFAPFQGSGNRLGLTGVLAGDGDHPNAAGHVLIAKALLAAGLPGLVRR